MSCILLLYFHVFSNPVFVFLVYNLYFRRKSKLILNLFVCFHKYAHLCAVI